ncbi:MAG: hypothetical protein Q9163_003287 [Psora crenata]
MNTSNSHVMLMSIHILGELPMDITMEEYEEKEEYLLKAGFDKTLIPKALYDANYNVVDAYWQLWDTDGPILGELPLEITLEEYEEKEAELLVAGFDKLAISQALYAAGYNLNEAFWLLDDRLEDGEEE